jgi:endonuclease/exonuclease/phosphatase family metal-dependent hydrolase
MKRASDAGFGAFMAIWLSLWGLSAPAGESHVKSRIVIASINIDRELDQGKMIKEFEKSPQLARPDILLLQEVEGQSEECRKMVQNLADVLGLTYVHMADSPPQGANGDGLVTLSRFPLKNTGIIPLKQFNLVFHSRRRIALFQTVETPLGEVLLFNLHLDTRINPEKRLEQLSTVLEASRSETRPVIIGGDFNTGDYRWLIHVMPIPNGRQTGAVIERMAESGFETPFRNMGPTHDSLGMRLDWIFLRWLKSFGAGIEEIDFSDHHAVWTEIGLP